jgi:hypothetical protein
VCPSPKPRCAAVREPSRLFRELGISSSAAATCITTTRRRARPRSPTDRLAFHQAHSGPRMAQLHVWLTTQLEEHRAEPNFGLGKAIAISSTGLRSRVCEGRGRRGYGDPNRARSGKRRIQARAAYSRDRSAPTRSRTKRARIFQHESQYSNKIRRTQFMGDRVRGTWPNSFIRREI